ncbi:MAG: hypothetical protein ACR2QF_10365 [Geminicoccaceae bacterium]
MIRHSLPIKRFDGSVLVEALRSVPAHPKGARRPRRRDSIGFNNIEVHRGKIVRDIAILALLATTIFAGFAALIGLILGDIAIAESQARIVEAELLVVSDERFEHEILPMALAGFGIAVAAFVLTRPWFIVER